MASIAERTSLVRDLEEAIREHCMCASLVDEGGRYLVLYPPGFYPDGVRASAREGKARALDALLKTMERHWQESMFWKQA